jgi:hypothetical protein
MSQAGRSITSIIAVCLFVIYLMTLSKCNKFCISEFVGNFERSDLLYLAILRGIFLEITKDKYEESVCGPKIDYGLYSCSHATFWKHGNRADRTTN